MELATDEEKMYMEEALKEAALAALEGEIPVGAILVQDGRVIARNHNRRERAHDATAHAEILVIREACEKLRRWRLADSTLYVTMEPCPMCAGACGSLFQIPLHPSLHANTIIKAGIEAERCKKILQEFFTRRR